MDYILPAKTVQVWQLAISDALPYLQTLQSFLSDAEQARAQRFVTQALTDNFICTRGVLRYLLSRYTGIAAGELAFSEGPHGKPFLMKDNVPSLMHFNVSHSGNGAVYAFSLDAEVGVDIEDTTRTTEVMAIAERFFTADEVKALKGLQKERRRDYFFYLWTRKEAFLKAIGKGLTQALDSVDVCGLQIINNGQQWMLSSLDVARPYCICVASIAGTERVALAPLRLDGSMMV
jgi:4'-phosphopantetheinyl transferase